jgi:hypothetical protein
MSEWVPAGTPSPVPSPVLTWITLCSYRRVFNYDQTWMSCHAMLKSLG